MIFFKAQIAMYTSKGRFPTRFLSTPFQPLARISSWAAVVAVLFLIGLEAAQGQLWTDLNGTRTVEARMIGLWGDSVILELAGGKRVAVKLDDLRSESRIQARKLAERLQSSRADRVQELQGNAAAASSAAPQPLPQPPAARPYQAPQQHLGVTEFVAQIDNAVSEGHLRAIYDALPPSYRKDVDDLVQLAASQLNQKSWQGLVGTAQRLGDVIVTHQNWFLSSPRIQALPPKDLDMVETQALSLAGVLRVGLSPDATNLNQLQTVSFGQWLTERDEAIAPYLAQLVNEIGIDVGRQVTVKSEKKETAIITVEQDGNQREIQLVSVDGYWVPKTIADQWSVNVDALKNDITDMTGMIDTLGLVVGSLNPALDPMANAQTSDQFHLAMNGLFSPTIQTAMITLATALGKTPTLASNQTAGGGNGGRGGYGDEDFEMGDEMGDEMAGGYGGSDPGRPGPGGPGSGGARPGPGGPGSGGARPGPGGPGSGGARPGPGGPGSGSGGVRPGPGGPESGGARPGPGGPESGGASLGELR